MSELSPSFEARAREMVRSVHNQGDNAPFQSLHLETLIRAIGLELQAAEAAHATWQQRATNAEQRVEETERLREAVRKLSAIMRHVSWGSDEIFDALWREGFENIRVLSEYLDQFSTTTE